LRSSALAWRRIRLQTEVLGRARTLRRSARRRAGERRLGPEAVVATWARTRSCSTAGPLIRRSSTGSPTWRP